MLSWRCATLSDRIVYRRVRESRARPSIVGNMARLTRVCLRSLSCMIQLLRTVLPPMRKPKDVDCRQGRTYFEIEINFILTLNDEYSSSPAHAVKYVSLLARIDITNTLCIQANSLVQFCGFVPHLEDKTSDLGLILE